MDSIVWTPTHPEKSNMAAFMRKIQTQEGAIHDYQTLHHWSITQPERFWLSLCDYFNLTFNTQPHAVLTHPYPMQDAQWFEGASLNFAEKLLFRRDEKIALVTLDETGNRQTLSYHDLYHQVIACANALLSAGVKPGDRVAAILPNNAYPIITLLATTAIGAIFSSCSPDFGAEALIDRLGQIEPRVLFICDAYQYNGKTHTLEEKIKTIHNTIKSISQLVICSGFQNTIPNSLRFEDFIQPFNSAPFTFQAFAFNHPLVILFSSGTTGKPKCIMHGAGGTLLQHIKELGLHTDLNDTDTLFFYTTCGWMMWNWMVSALSLGTTLVLYDGEPCYPESNRLFNIIEDETISVFGTSAKYLSTIEKSNFKPIEHYKMPALRTILSTGSPLLPNQYDFVEHEVKKGVQLSSISGGTDIISCFALGNPITPVYRGELQCIGLGMNVAIFNEQGDAVEGARGELVCISPFPSMPVGFWHDPSRALYEKAYFKTFPGIWAHGDFAEKTENGGLIIYGRSDAILNPGGVRIGTAEIYRQVEKIPEVMESIVIGQDWQDDTRVILFVKLREHAVLDEALEKNIRQIIRINASPRHVPAKIISVPEIPRTLSGKIVEIAVRQAVHGQNIQNLGALANPEALSYFKNRPELSMT